MIFIQCFLTLFVIFWRMKRNHTHQEPKVTITVQMQDSPIETIQLTEDQEIDVLLDYDTICKRILQGYKFIASGKQNIRVIINNFYGKQRAIPIPIFNPKNWTTLLADMLERQIRSVDVTVLKKGELRQRKKRVKQNPVEFDSEGSIESAEDNIIKEVLDKNKPANEPYQGEKIVRCHFCHLSSKEEKGKRASGPFYGPFQGNVYGHLLCLLWCSCIYLDSKGFLCNVEDGIKTAKAMQCRYCKLKGASFKCHSHSCNTISHYRCATLHSWSFNWSNFTVYCPQQANEINYPEALSGGTTRTLTLRQSQKKDNKMEIENVVKAQEEL